MAINDLTMNVASICNLALSHIGMKPITDLDTDVALNNPSALALNRHWGPCRNDVFREFKWPFATCQGQILHRVDIASTVYPEWDFYTTYPTSAVTVWNVYDATTADMKHEQLFEVVYNPTLAERVLLCNLDTVTTSTIKQYVEYTYNVTDTLIWDTKFVMAFSYRLASSVCMELTGDEKKAITLSEIYRNVIHEAKRVAHSEKKRKPTQKNPIVDSRG